MIRSFTLIELVMVIVIMAIIASAAIPLLISTTESWIIASRRNEMSESARISLDRIIREIRELRNDTSVIFANNSSFRFLNLANANISFSLSGNTLQRTINGTVNNLADNVNSLNFSYYNVTDSVISAPIVSPLATDIKRVQVDLVFSLGSTQLAVRAAVSPRRLE